MGKENFVGEDDRRTKMQRREDDEKTVMNERNIKVGATIISLFILLISYFAIYSMWIMSRDNELAKQMVSNTKDIRGDIKDILTQVSKSRVDIDFNRHSDERQNMMIGNNTQDIASIKKDIKKNSGDITGHVLNDASLRTMK